MQLLTTWEASKYWSSDLFSGISSMSQTNVAVRGSILNYFIDEYKEPHHSHNHSFDIALFPSIELQQRPTSAQIPIFLLPFIHSSPVQTPVITMRFSQILFSCAPFAALVTADFHIVASNAANARGEIVENTDIFIIGSNDDTHENKCSNLTTGTFSAQTKVVLQFGENDACTSG